MIHHKGKKIRNIAISAAFGVLAYGAVYCAKEASMTKWQREQPIDIEKKTGSTKFKAHIDAVSAGGIAFGISAIALAWRNKSKREK